MSTPGQRKYFTELISRLANPIAGRVPINLIVAVAALESNYGTSQLAVQANNLFGIKGKGISLPTTEIINGSPVKIFANFKRYTSPTESIKDYIRLLNSPRYVQALSKRNIYEIAKELQISGYSTNPNYAGSVNKIALSLKPGKSFNYLPLLGAGLLAYTLLKNK